MGIFTNGIHRTNQGLEKKENSLEVRLNDFCERNGRDRSTFTITNDGLVNCSRFVTIFDDDLVEGKLPFKFGEVKGNFGCSCCKKITSLEGSPNKVGGSFGCNYCPELKSLEGCPEEVGGDFFCGDCGVCFCIHNVRCLCNVKGGVHITHYY